MIRLGIGRLRQFARFTKNRARRGGLILIYHRVAELGSGP
jgi:hypothetical protein